MGSRASFLAPSQAQPSSAQASPAHHAGQVSPAQPQLTNRKPSPARPAQVRPGQATAEPSPGEAVVWALPKLCQSLFLPGLDAQPKLSPALPSLGQPKP